MTARGIIESERHENLAAFEEVFGQLEGVNPEHVESLRKATTTTGGAARFPSTKDPLAQAAYTAAALRGLAGAIAASQSKAARTK